ncbi:MAG: redoxin family protein [Planctomycetota bacterium]
MRGTRITRLAAWFVTIVGLSLGMAHAKEEPVALGEKVPDLVFKDQWYLPRSLKEFGEKQAFVVVFVSSQCPAVEQVLGELKRLENVYRAKGVQFVAINVGAEDSIRTMADQAMTHDLPFPFVKDFAGAWPTTLGIDKTPGVAVLDAKHRLVYRGRVDSRVSLDGAPRNPERADLETALDELLAGKPVSVSQTEVKGTPIHAVPQVTVQGPVNFSEHVAPLLKQHCQQCHDSGPDAPFALRTLSDAVQHAETMVEVVDDERMPPWYASHGNFSNKRGMTAEERATLRKWVRTGMAAGDPAKLPEPLPVPNYNAGEWSIGKPDRVITATQVHKLPAKGYVDYKYVILPYVFLHDTWVQGIEIRPSNPKVVHHCNMGYLTLGGKDWANAKFVTGKVPGVQPMNLGDGIAFRFAKGAVMILQIHYTTTGKEEECQISVGIRHARGVVKKEFHDFWMVDGKFAIPPGDAAYPVAARNTLPTDVVALGLFHHMHVRGKNVRFFAHFPDGRDEELLRIPNYSFDWQMAYSWNLGERKFPKGTVLECVANYDNSPFNPYNPDPSATVREGDQTFQEMLNGVFFYIDEKENLNLTIDPKTGRVIDPGKEHAQLESQ